MKKKIIDRYSLKTNLNLNSGLLPDHIKTTNINILLNRVKIEKKNDFKKKLYLLSIMTLGIIFFSALVISI